MQTWKLAALLLLQCWIPGIACQYTQRIDLGSLGGVGSVSYKGERLQVYELDGVQFAEPRVDFDGACGSLRYNHLYQKHQMTLPFKITANALATPLDHSKKSGSATITGVKVIADKGLASKESGVTVMVRLTKSGGAQLLLLCSSFDRCKKLGEVATNPEDLRLAVRFVVFGRVGNNPVKFGAVRSPSSPRFRCAVKTPPPRTTTPPTTTRPTTTRPTTTRSTITIPPGWVVFQQRVDGSLSFERSWDAYVRGFGNPNSNYWMGLKRLSESTITGKGDGSRCRMRVEMLDHNGKHYWAQYDAFEVRGPSANYQLRIRKEVPGSWTRFASNNWSQFSTYDRDNDSSWTSCSKSWGSGGWWFQTCGDRLNLSGRYTTQRYLSPYLHPEKFMAIHDSGRYVSLKTTVLMFKCRK